MKIWRLTLIWWSHASNALLSLTWPPHRDSGGGAAPRLHHLRQRGGLAHSSAGAQLVRLHGLEAGVAAGVRDAAEHEQDVEGHWGGSRIKDVKVITCFLSLG